MHLRFADDVIIILKSKREMKESLNKVNGAGQVADFKLNRSETVLMTEAQEDAIVLQGTNLVGSKKRLI